MTPTVLIVDDKPNIVRLLDRMLREKCRTLAARDGGEALQVLQHEAVDVVVTDLRMPVLDGMSLFHRIRTERPGVDVILMTAFAEVEQAVAAMKEGAADYIRKPFDPDDAAGRILRVVDRRATGGARPGKDTERRRAAALVGESEAMARVRAMVQQAASTEVTALITGESGTGKELVARAIHQGSARAQGPFVPVNCGAIPGPLLESEIFGHAKGAFSGAIGEKRGLAEEAEAGVLFLDEIGDMSGDLQSKLNRVLQERTVRRVGENVERPVNIRFIAATHRDLKGMVEDHEFREDLFYRLNVLAIHLPPLRERFGDLRPLAMHFLERAARTAGKTITAIDDATFKVMEDYPWPGNVRELENAISRAVVLETTAALRPESLSEDIRTTGGTGLASLPPGWVELPYKEAMKRVSDEGARDYLAGLLKKFGGNVTQASRQAGLERESLHRILKKYGLNPSQFRQGG